VPRSRKLMLRGEKHGRLIYDGFAGKTSAGKSIGRFICDCGVTKNIVIAHVRGGYVVSCGCFSNELRAATFTKHGEAAGGKTVEYKIWEGLRKRCTNPNNNEWENYGGRGITVCERWNSFENFLADMGRRPSPKHSLDRWPDNDGAYEPGNCRWATDIEQQRNTRKNFLVSVGGRRMTLAEACGGSRTRRYNLAYQRITKFGWASERAISTP